MNNSGHRWRVTDRSDNLIYLTEERWLHITDIDNHPEVAEFEGALRETIQFGRRRQEPLNPRKYRYYRFHDGLPDDFNHIVVIVLFGFKLDDQGQTVPNNYVATAFFNYIRIKS